MIEREVVAGMLGALEAWTDGAVLCEVSGDGGQSMGGPIAVVLRTLGASAGSAA